MIRRRYLNSGIRVPELSSGYLTFRALEDNILFSIDNFNNESGPLYYSINGDKWKKFRGTTETINNGDNIYWYGNGIFRRFVSSGNFIVSGNLLSLCGREIWSTDSITFLFESLFENCTNLISAYNLQFPNVISSYCYTGMFKGCISLIEAPISLHYDNNFSDTLKQNCYDSMFEGCTSLVTPPEIIENGSALWCCRRMFANCTSLTYSPIIKCTMTQNGFEEMFDGCTSLSEITCTSVPNSNNTQNWVRNVSSNGIFYEGFVVEPWTIGNSGIPTGWLVAKPKCLTFTALEDTTFTFTTNALQYSLDDGATWTTLAANTATPTVSAGNKIIWKQTGLTPSTSYPNPGIGTFSATGNFEASGNIMSLLFGNDFVGQTNLAGMNYVFYGLFFNCNKLVNAENLILPATTLALYCYCVMFYNCTSLTTAPELPATILANYCYQSMFQGCTSLTTPPELLAKTLVYNCYGGIFLGCTSLNYIKCLATEKATNNTGGWTINVAPIGIFIKDRNTTWAINGDAIPKGWAICNDNETPLIIDKLSIIIADNFNLNDYILPTVINPYNLPITYSSSDLSIISINSSTGQITLNDYGTVTISAIFAGNETYSAKTVTYTIEYYEEMPYNLQYLTFEALEDGTFTFSKTVKYSINNGITWITLSSGITSPTVTVGNKIMWKQTGLAPTSSAGIGTFSATGNFKVYGNIMSLYYGDDFIGRIDLTGKSYAFFNLFKDNTKLVNVENLILPATTLADSCYRQMFYNCSSLTTVFNILPALTLRLHCYRRMFYGCQSLVKAPILPASTSTDYCYESMFSSCKVLNYVKCLLTYNDSDTLSWLSQVAATGTFVKADNMTSWTTGMHGIPTEWTVINESEET